MKLGAIFLILVFKGQTQAVEWNYTTLGADWPILVETCGGDRQSPINIQREKTIKYEGSDFVDFSTSYCGKTNGILKNNGHTLKWETEDGLPSRTSYITGGPLGDSKYYFLQFHLHWGSSSTRGSEHIIDGERYFLNLRKYNFTIKPDLELQLSCIWYMSRKTTSMGTPGRSLLGLLKLEMVCQFWAFF